MGTRILLEVSKQTARIHRKLVEGRQLARSKQQTFGLGFAIL